MVGPVPAKIADTGNSMTASRRIQRMGLFLFFLVETAAVCEGRVEENTLVSILSYFCFLLYINIYDDTFRH